MDIPLFGVMQKMAANTAWSFVTSRSTINTVTLRLKATKDLHTTALPFAPSRLYKLIEILL